MGEVISLGERRKEVAEFCLSIILTSDGKAVLNMDTAQFETKEQVNWALSQLALSVHELVEYKMGLTLTQA